MKQQPENSFKKLVSSMWKTDDLFSYESFFVDNTLSHTLIRWNSLPYAIYVEDNFRKVCIVRSSPYLTKSLQKFFLNNIEKIIAKEI